MLDFILNRDPSKTLNILCLGAHCDDIEIGCGGTLLSILDVNTNVNISWYVFTSTQKRAIEAKKGATLFSKGSNNLDVKILQFRDGFLPYEGSAVKEAFEQIKNDIDTPDIIFTHYRNDLHQDHRKISELTWNTFRNHLVLEYEIPKWDGDIGTPNAFVVIDPDTAREKIENLQQIYNSQQDKSWFTDDLFWSLIRIRGMEANSPSGLAEGFYIRKALIASKL